MKNKRVALTSITAIFCAAPALAETWPTNGLMQENTTYENAATYENIGVYSGSAIANANYGDITYSVTAGNYLTGLDASNNATTATCTSGNYCVGVDSTTYDNETSAFGTTGLTSCPTEYPNSDTGATAESKCYRACSTTDVAHSTSVSGAYYYGDNNQCEPTECAKGWTLKENISVLGAIATTQTVNSAYAYVRNNGEYNEYIGSSDTKGTKRGQTYYGIEDKNTFAIDYDNGIVIGQGRCSTQAGSNGLYTNGTYDNNGDWSNTTKLATLTDETGNDGAKYCYCNVTGYKASSSAALQGLSSLWVFQSNIGDASSCASRCANYCAGGLLLDGAHNLAFRSAVFGPKSYATCEANPTINCDSGYYLPVDSDECKICPENAYCSGGEFDFGESADQGKQDCPYGEVSPAGTQNKGGCGKILHIGEDSVYLTSEKQTSPAFAVRVADKTYYANMTPVTGEGNPINMHKGTNKSWHTVIDGVEYVIYDDTAKAK